jgi:threonine efflux protein
MSLIVIITLFTTFLIAVVVPGQDFVTVVRLSVSRSRQVGIAAAAGVSTGLFIWALAALLGVSALLEDNTNLSRVLRLGGAIVLTVFGAYSVVRAVFARQKTSPETWGVDGSPVRGPLLGGWATGLLSNLSNVKLLVFFGTIFSGVLPDDLDSVETPLIAIAMAALAFGWFSLVALLGSHPRVSRAYRRANQLMDVVFGLVLVVIGVLIFSSSP